MKNIILLFSLIALSVITFAQSTTPRFGIPPHDNTYRQLTNAYVHSVYGSTITLAPNAYETIVQVDSLTGTLTLAAGTTNALCGDRIYCSFISDSATAGHVITFGSGMNAPTLTIAKNKRGGCVFIYNGTSWVGIGVNKE